MANALTLTAAALPSANAASVLGVAASGNVNGDSSAGWTFAGGASGAGDTIANAELLKGVPANSRLYSFLSQSYLTQAALDNAVAALGLVVNANGASSLRLITAAPGVPTATVTTAAATGALVLKIGQSVGN
jgi:hypothetical protein